MNDPAIRYQCQRCGQCCRWPGEVVLDDEEIRTMATHLGETEHEFIQNYTALRRSRAGLTLAERPDGTLILLNGNNACSVHESKPAQCKAFPNTWRFPGWRQICEATPAVGT
jgi:Fe-S-cluster containining protein